MEKQIRYSEGVEFREAQEGSNSIGTIYGKAVVFNTPSSGLPWVEYVSDKAISQELLDNSDVIAEWEHDRSLLGRTSSGTLRLELRSDAVYYELDLPNTTAGKDVKELVGRRDLKGCSYEFRASKEDGDDVRKMVDGKIHRDINKFDVFRKINIVSNPAFDATTVDLELRSMTDNLEDLDKANKEELKKRQAQELEVIKARLRTKLK